ncbi:superoxide dismutase [Patescibacteria group bacterium]|nr:superoxide dismutase [Patescibacteria group bacterium]
MFTLNKLPYSLSALEPYMSEQTLSFHYGKHHQAYVDNLNKLIDGTEMEDLSLEEIVVKTANKTEFSAIFNNAAQVYNHNIFWDCLKPVQGTEENKEVNIAEGELLKAIEASFESWDNFLNEFKTLALSQFGSGWAWLVKDGDLVKIIKTPNGENPLSLNLKPLIGIDVWEHSYYLDYQNRRGDYLEAIFKNLVDWRKISQKFLEL